MDTGLNSYQIDLSQGPAPLYYVFALSTLDRLAGNETTCMTKFMQYSLKSFDLIRDQDSVTGFPLTGQGLASGSFYNNFLKQTNRFLFHLDEIVLLELIVSLYFSRIIGINYLRGIEVKITGCIGKISRGCTGNKWSRTY